MRPRFLKTFFLTFVLCSMVFVLSAPASAQTEFTVDYNTTYEIEVDGTANVLNRITLTNNLSEVYATLYTLTLQGKKPESIFATQDGVDLPSTVVEGERESKISVSFPDSLVGKGRARTFEIGYKQKNVAIQNGQVWDLTLPKLGQPETINSYELLLKVPLSFGAPAYISPDPRSKTRSSTGYELTFNKEDLGNGVTGAFGEFQVFSFKLTYHLSNPYSKTGETEIALPPDTALQRVYYQSILPKPQKIRLDNDGNWLGTFRLAGREELSVLATGVVQIFTEPQEQFPKVAPGEVQDLLTAQPYWEVNDPQIQKLASELKNPQAIFNFVTKTLSYDYSRIGREVKRLGAVGALLAPENALCMEFTDLFVALARAAGIPAREVNGYAYTENPELQPLSLVADVLHSWPEFWDVEENIWRPVDPTWENTTGGVDYFNKFDLSHVTFAIHGQSSGSPAAAGTYKLDSSDSRDVQITFGQLPSIRETGVAIDVTSPKTPFSLFEEEMVVHLSNSGPTAIYSQPITLEPEGLEVVKSEQTSLDFLAPYDETSFKITFKSPFLPIGGERKIKITVGDIYLPAQSSFTYVVSPGKAYMKMVFTIFLVLLLILGAFFTILRFASHGKRKN